MGSALTEELDHSERFRSDEEDHPNEVQEMDWNYKPWEVLTMDLSDVVKSSV